MYRWTPLFAIAGLAGLAGLVGCPDPLADCLNTATCPPDAGAPSCAGECVPVSGPPWTGPYVVWMGNMGSDEQLTLPACPTSAPALYGPWYTAPSAPVCQACECAKSTGTCALPTTVTAKHPHRLGARGLPRSHAAGLVWLPRHAARFSYVLAVVHVRAFRRRMFPAHDHYGQLGSMSGKWHGSPDLSL
jgi:hypothetical protein